jgi:NAD-dependent oxidoreductase involved in siderophore biosynthesis
MEAAAASTFNKNRNRVWLTFLRKIGTPADVPASGEHKTVQAWRALHAIENYK